MFIQTDAFRGKGGGRGGSRGGGRRGGGGRSRGPGRHGSGGGYRGGSRGSSRGGGGRTHSGKGVYGRTSTGLHGRVGGPGSYNYRASYNARGGLQSVSRAYGLGRSSGFGQPGTGRGSFRISGRNFNRGIARGNRRFGGSSFRAPAMSPAPTPPGDGGGDEPTTPPGSGTERSVRIRNSPARRTAFGRGRRAQGSRRSLRIGQSLGGIALGGNNSRSGVNV